MAWSRAWRTNPKPSPSPNPDPKPNTSLNPNPNPNRDPKPNPDQGMSLAQLNSMLEQLPSNPTMLQAWG